MARWDRPGVPHKGWTEVGCIDIREDAFDDENIEYEICEMCNNERIMFIFLGIRSSMARSGLVVYVLAR